MREIKFRGIDENGEFIYSPKDWCLSTFFIMVESKEISHIEQFTGILDKNGKEIYEGDILRNCKLYDYNEYGEYDQNTRLEVVFYMGCFMLKPKNIPIDSLYIKSICEAIHLRNVSGVEFEPEIIGNIHE